MHSTTIWYFRNGTSLINFYKKKSFQGLNLLMCAYWFVRTLLFIFNCFVIALHYFFFFNRLIFSLATIFSKTKFILKRIWLDRLLATQKAGKLSGRLIRPFLTRSFSHKKSLFSSQKYKLRKISKITFWTKFILKQAINMLAHINMLIFDRN